jgi:NCS2 family nucleobase:cation symporter-2/xanthine permease XanP
VLYEPNERPPNTITFALGFQAAMLCIAGIVITPVIVVRAAGGGEPYLSWAVFGALLVSGLTTVLQAVRVGRIGAGYVLLMGTSGAFIAVCVTALAKGGPAMLATLVVISSLFQFALSTRLSLLRRIITPTVAGTVIMLIAVTVMPIVFDMLADVPEGTPSAAAPACAIATLFVIVMLALRVSGVWRLWVPIIGIVVGCLVASFFGLYDIQRVIEAPWIGFPAGGGWPGFDLSFGPVFWSLLPAFIFVTLVGAIETIGDSIAIQKVSWRTPRAPDFRAVQGAVTADGVGNLLSGIAGTVPNTTYSSSVSITELTGVAARGVGVCIGIVFVTASFLPKVSALLLAIPNPVVGAYVTVLLALLFVVGMRIIVQDGVDYRKAMIAGVAFWIGVGFQDQAIFAEYLGEWWGALLGNGMTAGGLTAIFLTLFIELTAPRRRRIETALTVEALPEIVAFLEKFASRRGWDDEMTNRLCLSAEETLLILIQQGEDEQAKKRLLLIVRSDGSNGAELEFIASTGEGNIEDRMAYLREQTEEMPIEHEISLRLLQHFTSSVRHQQYHDADIVMVRVEVPVGDRRSKEEGE